MHSIEVVLVMLLSVVVSGYLARLIPGSIPLPLVQIGFGAVIAGVFNHGVTLEPELFFLLFLPPLLFLDGWRVPKIGLLHDRGIILELAFGLVVFTVVGAGFLIHWLIPAIPLPVAFALAAIVSPTDPVAVSSIAAKVPIPKRMMHILEGESLLNDASGLVCFRFAVAAALTGGFSLASASLTFLWVASVGVAVGIAVTVGIALMQRWLSRHLGEDNGSPILVSLLIPFGAYLLAERLQASGILAAVAAGVTMSHVELSGRTLATTRVHRAVVWDTVQFALNGMMFVLLGEQLPAILKRASTAVQEAGHSSDWWLLIYALAISLGLTALRFLWVWVSLRVRIFHHPGDDALRRAGWRVVAVLSLAGVRGAITLAGVLTLPLALPDGSAFPARDLVIFLAMSVILISLVTASLGLPLLLRGLQAPAQTADQQAEAFALREAARAAIAAIEAARQKACAANPDAATLYADAATRVMAQYQSALQEESIAGGTEADQLLRADEAEVRLRLAALEAERETLFALARRYEISDALSRKLVRRVDLIEARYR